ncbi:MAG TPA: four helix bundle protein [Polyangiales bacterium]|nr:four helix bundle protein [Polyangiales bacterium]
MPLDHERLDVYQIALRFHDAAHAIAARVPRGEGDLADQLRRASNSVLLNIAEGAGRMSRAEKRRFYVIARGSVNECGALLDAVRPLGIVDEAKSRAHKEDLVRMFQMLVKLAKVMERKR